jgi:Caspase domain
MNFTEQMLGDDFQIPTVAFLTELPLATRQRSITLQLKAHDAKYLLDRLNVYVNGVPLGGSAGITVRDKKTSSWEQPVDIELSRGPNRIELSAINEKGAESLRESLEINCDAPPGKPDLYVVVVGVSAYEDTRYRLTYADKDANDLANYLKTRKENFNQLRLVRLVNQDATRDKILEAKQLLRQSKVDDLVIVFFAGHGLLDDRLDYYFATVDVDFSKPSAKGMSYEAIEDLLDGIPARKKLLLMDTCHSGEVDKEEMTAQVAQQVGEGNVKERGFRGLDVGTPFGLQNSLRVQQELFADLRRGSGAVMVSAAGGMEFALESANWKNGVFTYALLRGLKDKQADRNRDNHIQVSELRDYITDEVRRLTRNRQSPTIRMENLEFDYTLD